MRKKELMGVLCGALCLIPLGAAQAATVNIFENSGVLETVDSLSTYSTTGLNMTGMEVIVNYSGGGFQSVSWDGNGAGTGAVGADWSLTMSDPSVSTYYSSWWIFDTSGSAFVESIVLNGFDHNVIFDNDEDNYPGTPGSAWGNPLQTDYYSTSTTYAGNINVTYLGDIALTGFAPYGDVYQSMSIEFASGSFGVNDTLSFYQDTDNITNPVPEPATMLLFGAGMAGLIGSRFRRKKS